MKVGLTHQKLNRYLLWKVGNNQESKRVLWEHSFLLETVDYRTDTNKYQLEGESDVLDKAIQDLNCNGRIASVEVGLQSSLPGSESNDRYS